METMEEFKKEFENADIKPGDIVTFDADKVRSFRSGPRAELFIWPDDLADLIGGEYTATATSIGGNGLCAELDLRGDNGLWWFPMDVCKKVQGGKSMSAKLKENGMKSENVYPIETRVLEVCGPDGRHLNIKVVMFEGEKFVRLVDIARAIHHKVDSVIYALNRHIGDDSDIRYFKGDEDTGTGVRYVGKDCVRRLLNYYRGKDSNYLKEWLRASVWPDLDLLFKDAFEPEKPTYSVADLQKENFRLMQIIKKQEEALSKSGANGDYLDAIIADGEKGISLTEISLGYDEDAEVLVGTLKGENLVDNDENPTVYSVMHHLASHDGDWTMKGRIVIYFKLLQNGICPKIDKGEM